MRRWILLMLVLTMTALTLTACGKAERQKAQDTPQPSQSAAAQPVETKTIQGIVNRMDAYLVLLTEDGEYYTMDYGEDIPIHAFAEGDRVEVTYTGELGKEDLPPTITAITKVQ